MNHSIAHDLIPAYVLGTLDESDFSELEIHLSGCPECALQVDEARSVSALIGYVAPLESPPPSGLSRLMSSIQPAADTLTSTERRGRLRGWAAGLATAFSPWRGLPGVAMAVLALILIGGDAMLFVRGTAATTQIDSLRDRVDQQSDMLMMVSSGDVVSRRLLGTDRAPGAQARLVMNRSDGEAMVMARNLPELPTGFIYTVWVGRTGTKQPAGQLLVDHQGNGECKVSASEPLRMYDTMWITMDPAKDTPRGDSPGLLSGRL